MAVACGSNGNGQRNIPALEAGETYTQVAAGGGHTVLLKDNGQAIACGSNDRGQCLRPSLAKRKSSQSPAQSGQRAP